MIKNARSGQETSNQPKALCFVNLFTDDAVIQDFVKTVGIDPKDAALLEAGRIYADPELFQKAQTANRYVPQLHTLDAYGKRIDQVQYHPYYHDFMEIGIGQGLASAAWFTSAEHPHLRRAIKQYFHNQIEQGTSCPITMSYASVPALKTNPELFEELVPLLSSKIYDKQDRYYARKKGLTLGMAMTEKQGGSDVRANTTTARPQNDYHYRLQGHKWFCSAPMSDLFLMLAQTEDGLSCFAVPRWMEEDSKNPIYLQRLKDKLGNKSNASSEIELENTFGRLMGEEGRGIKTIIQMVAMTRFDCLLGSAAMMRQAVSQAYNHASQRKAFGYLLIHQPLMRNVLADIALEAEAAAWFAFYTAQQIDELKNEEAQFWLRIAAPVGKYWICKRAIAMIHEAQECLGGLGYIEDSNLPRLYREAPVNSIWEGSGNIQCLDVLRILNRQKEILEWLLQRLQIHEGKYEHYDQTLRELLLLQKEPDSAFNARRTTELLARLMQAYVLLEKAPPPIATVFIQNRLGSGLYLQWGTLKNTKTVDLLIERAKPT